MAGMQCSMIKQLDDSSEMWRIVARVVRRWHSYHKDSPHQLYAICFLLMDQKGDKIQASVMNKSLFRKFEKEPEEGQSYFIANMEVIPNAKDYKSANHPFKLLFNSATFVREEPAEIPLSLFNFFSIKDILNQSLQHHTMFLFDVIAFVKSIEPLEEYYSGGDRKTKLRLGLADERGNNIQMVLYDACATNFPTHELTSTQKPTVLLAQLARIGFDEDGHPEICSSFEATKIHINANFQEVSDFISSAEHIPSPTISSITPTPGSQHSNSTAETILRNTPTIKVADIPLQEVGNYFAVICELKKCLTRDRWYYDGCSRCGTKPNVDNGVASCTNHYCRGKKCTIQTKLRLNYLIADESGTASIVFFDKQATELLKKTASQLKAEIPENQRDFAFPEEVNHFLGKKMLLKMKLNNYNKNHPNSSVSVTTFAEATDLNDAFDAAASEIGQPSICNEEEDEIILLRNCTATDKGQPTPDQSEPQSEILPTVDIDEISLSDDIQVIPSKGKRKVSAKKQSEHVLKSATYGPSSPSKTPSKPLKWIKKEKN